MNQDLGFTPERTALLVIDPVNDFLSDGGAAWELTRTTVLKHNVVGHLKQAIEGARRNGIPVLFGPMAYTEEDYSADRLYRRSPINRLMYERRMFQAGSWGADFHPELRPQDQDIVLEPHKGIDVFETDLPQHLADLGVAHLVICGMTASLCCESTGRHAMERGYDVTFLSDAIGSDNIPSYEAAIRVTYPMIANSVMTVREFIQSLESPSRLRPGDIVRGSDHLKIGRVIRVIQGEQVEVPYIEVHQGRFFKKPLYIPLDAIVRRAGDTLFVNVPRIVVGKTPWRKPPSSELERVKHGPRQEQVGKLYRSMSPQSQKTA